MFKDGFDKCSQNALEHTEVELIKKSATECEKGKGIFSLNFLNHKKEGQLLFDALTWHVISFIILACHRCVMREES